MRALIIILILLLIAFVGWHLFFPVVVVGATLTAGAWAFLVGAITVFCILFLGLFIASGMGIVLLGVLGLAFAITALVLFPFLLPILIPLLIIMLFLCLFRGKQSKSKAIQHEKNES